MGNAAALSGLPLSHDSAHGEQMESNNNGNDNNKKKSSAFALSVRMCGDASFRKKPQLKDRLRESDNIHAGPFRWEKNVTMEDFKAVRDEFVSRVSAFVFYFKKVLHAAVAQCGRARVEVCGCKDPK